ncbi:spore germination protein [Desulfofalx alkaliphila]|uniref:spore germination protein n=1 Tax=Desulfofalx alkaliphila TaxID=105483 RepID=UPI0004E28CD2|nr:spore germination protein [Desulfofalx alkaliphila]
MRGKKSYPSANQAADLLNRQVSADLHTNVEIIQKLFSEMPDLIIHSFKVNETGTPAALVFIDGLNEKKVLNDNILYPLIHETKLDKPHLGLSITASNIKTELKWSNIEEALLLGSAVLFMDGQANALILDTQGWVQRESSEPQNESALRGAHQGFVETAKFNIAMIRRYVASRELKMKQLMVGKRVKTQVFLLYLADVANPQVVQEMERRIRKLDVDAIINTGELKEYIEDNRYSIFPQFQVSERPDNVALNILKGRVAVVVDRSPGVIVAPATLLSFFQTVDDYSFRWILTSFIRLLRVFAAFIALFLPSLYIAIVTFHYEVMPLDIAMIVGESREKVPFTPIVEALLMEVTLEMLREAGLRLPSPIGQAIGIVGGIVIGQAAIDAAIVSNLLVVVVALTAIASFIIPNPEMSASIRLLRFPMMILASLFGMVGVMAGMMMLVAHLISLESLRTPLASPFAPLRLTDLKDAFIRFPIRMLQHRPHDARPTQRRKQGQNKRSGD